MSKIVINKLNTGLYEAHTTVMDMVCSGEGKTKQQAYINLMRDIKLVSKHFEKGVKTCRAAINKTIEKSRKA